PHRQESKTLCVHPRHKLPTPFFVLQTLQTLPSVIPWPSSVGDVPIREEEVCQPTSHRSYHHRRAQGVTCPQESVDDDDDDVDDDDDHDEDEANDDAHADGDAEEDGVAYQ